MTGAGIYSYRYNFACKKDNTKNPYRKSFKVKLVDLFRPYYRYFSPFDDDLFVGICQFLMKQGSPGSTYSGRFIDDSFSVTADLNEVDKFLSDTLFSVDMFYAEHLYINKGKFDLMKWREQFDIFTEMKITGLKYYRSRAAMPIGNFESFGDVKKLIFNGYNRYGKEFNTLECGYNECHKDARYIMTRSVIIYPDYFYYHLTYGTLDDYNNWKSGKGHSSWDIYIRSEDNENYIDFCLRIFNNYATILQRDNNIIEQESQYSSYYKLKN